MFKRLATSFGFFPIGPGVSYLRLVGMILAPSMIPIDALRVYSEALVDDVTRDPSVSVPRAIGAKPALTAMEDPEEEPSGL